MTTPFTYTIPAPLSEVAAAIRNSTDLSLLPILRPLRQPGRSLRGWVLGRRFQVSVRQEGWLQSVAVGTLRSIPGGTEVEGVMGVPVSQAAGAVGALGLLTVGVLGAALGQPLIGALVVLGPVVGGVMAARMDPDRLADQVKRLERDVYAVLPTELPPPEQDRIADLKLQAARQMFRL